MSTIISLIISSTSILSKIITLEAFIKYKNLVLEISGLVIVSHITTNNAQIIWIYNQVFASSLDI